VTVADCATIRTLAADNEFRTSDVSYAAVAFDRPIIFNVFICSTNDTRLLSLSGKSADGPH